MKRFLIIGIVVITILGIAGTMALVSDSVKADNAVEESQLVQPMIDEAADAETAVTQDPITNPAGQNFVDENGDGICDTCGNVPGTGDSNFVDEDGDGVCDNCGNVPGSGTGNQNGNGRNGAAGSTFIDENSDGICDTCGNVPNGSSRGVNNFVDEDGDGVCDTCGTAPADGTGNQYGRQGGQGQRGNGRGNNQT